MMKTARIATAAVALTLSVLSATAEGKTIAEVDWCWTVANFDDFTDELSYVYLSCLSRADHSKRVVLGINAYTPYLMFVDQGREWQVPDDQAEVTVAYRFDRRPAVTVKATWDAHAERAELLVDRREAEEFLAALLSADLLIYRIGGERAYVHRIELSGDREVLVDATAEYVQELMERADDA